MTAAAVVPIIMMNNSARIARENRERRIRNGSRNDEIYIETKKDKKEIGRKIASLYENWYYGEGSIWLEKPNFNSGAYWFSIFACMVVAHFYWLIHTGAFYDISYFENLKSMVGIASLLVSGIFSVFIGFVMGGDDVVSYIELSDKGVLLKIYDSNGYRNIHEDELNFILKAIK